MSSRPMFAIAMIFSLIYSVSCGNASHSGQGNPSVKPREALLSSMKAKLNARSYRAKSIDSDSVLEGDYVAPDNYHLFGEYRGGGKIERIMIHNAAYVKPPNGEWRKDPHPEKPEFSIVPDEMLIDVLGKSSDDDVKLAGTEDLDGARMHVYQYAWGVKDTDSGRLKAWVGTDGFPYQIELEGRIQGAHFKETITFYDYNVDKPIRPPL